MSRWIDGAHAVGTVGFLVEVRPQDRADTWHLDTRPECANVSRAPRLRGWCGETNNTAVYAHGLARVVAAKQNRRVQVEPLDKGEYDAALEELGYPDLCP